MSFSDTIIKVLKDNKKAKETLWPDTVNWNYWDWKPRAKFPQIEELFLALVRVPAIIAGGSILGCYRGLRFNDIDIFPYENTAIDKTCQTLERLGYKKRDGSEFIKNYIHTSSVYKPVQLILAHTDAKSPQEVLRRFDLTIVQLGLCSGRLITNDLTLRDIDNKTLRVTGTLSIKSLQERIDKYKERGFKIWDEVKGS